jgi:hypothetical protein
MCSRDINSFFAKLCVLLTCGGGKQELGGSGEGPNRAKSEFEALEQEFRQMEEEETKAGEGGDAATNGGEGDDASSSGGRKSGLDPNDPRPLFSAFNGDYEAFQKADKYWQGREKRRRKQWEEVPPFAPVAPPEMPMPSKTESQFFLLQSEPEVQPEAQSALRMDNSVFEALPAS